MCAVAGKLLRGSGGCLIIRKGVLDDDDDDDDDDILKGNIRN